MKAMMLTGIRQMEMRDVPTPAILNDRDVRIKMKTLGVCGSDIHSHEGSKGWGTRLWSYWDECYVAGTGHGSRGGICHG